MPAKSLKTSDVMDAAIKLASERIKKDEIRVSLTDIIRLAQWEADSQQDGPPGKMEIIWIRK